MGGWVATDSISALCSTAKGNVCLSTPRPPTDMTVKQGLFHWFPKRLSTWLSITQFPFRQFTVIQPDQMVPSGGRNSSVGSAWARCPQRRGFYPPLGTFSGRGDFSLGVNMGSNSIPPKTPSDESINRGLVCAHMHFIARFKRS